MSDPKKTLRDIESSGSAQFIHQVGADIVAIESCVLASEKRILEAIAGIARKLPRDPGSSPPPPATPKARIPPHVGLVASGSAPLLPHVSPSNRPRPSLRPSGSRTLLPVMPGTEGDVPRVTTNVSESLRSEGSFAGLPQRGISSLQGISSLHGISSFRLHDPNKHLQRARRLQNKRTSLGRGNSFRSIGDGLSRPASFFSGGRTPRKSLADLEPAMPPDSDGTRTELNFDELNNLAECAESINEGSPRGTAPALGKGRSMRMLGNNTERSERSKMEDEIMELFKMMDKGGTGTVPLDELREYMPTSISEQDAKRLLNDVDVDGDGTCSLAEFRVFFEKITRGQSSVMHALDAKQQMKAALAAAIRHTDGVNGFMKDQATMKKEGVLKPHSRGRWWFHGLLLFMILVDVFEICMSFVSRAWYSQGWGGGYGTGLRVFMTLWTGACDIAFMVEAYLCLRTEVCDGWQIVDDAKQIKRKYLKGWCKFDVLISLPFAEIFAAAGLMLPARILRAVKILRVGSVPRLFLTGSPIKERPKAVTLMIFVFWNLVGWLSLATVWMGVMQDYHIADEDGDEFSVVVPGYSVDGSYAGLSHRR
eukprot:Hpha_TRINITY_DN26438_c0_g1::TRINITY_DN26438_c0_g1_i2::g.33990::m.33990